ncbi:MAG TPA: PAS domain-containing protein, partial [Gemmataceae bacterium]|nr:PAS domain-containing protein [Gemmataceae bacterium]
RDPFVLLRRHSIALLVTGLALVFTLILWPVTVRFPYVLFLAAVLASAWQGGSRSALVTTFLSTITLVVLYAFASRTEGARSGWDWLIRLVLFVLIGLLAAFLSRQFSRAMRAVDHVHDTLSSTGDALLFADARGRVTALNPPAQALTGWLFANARGQPFGLVFRLRTQGASEASEELLAKALRGAGPVALPIDAVLISSQGVETAIEGTAVPLRNAERRVVGMMVAFRDAAQRRQQLDAVRQSAGQWRAVISGLPVATAVLDADGRCTYVNAAFASLAGASANDCRGDGWTRVVPALERNRLIAAATTPTQGNLSAMAQFRVPLAAGQSRWLQVHSTPLADAQQKRTGHVVTALDISERKRLEQSEQAGAERFALFMQHLPGIAFLKDAGGKYVYANPGFEQALHLEKNAWQGKTDEELFPYPGFAQYRPLLDPAKAGDQEAVTMELVLKNGGVQVYHTRQFSLHDGPEGVELIGVIGADMSAHRQAEERLQEAQSDFDRQVQEHASRRTAAEEALRQAHDEAQRLAEAQSGHMAAADELRQAHAALEARANEAVARQKKAEEALRKTREELARVSEQLAAQQKESQEQLGAAQAAFELRLQEHGGEHEETRATLTRELAESKQAVETLRAEQQRLQALLAESQRACERLQEQTAVREAAERKLQEEKDLLESLVESCEDGIFAFDRNGCLTTWNAAMERISSIPRSQALGKAVAEVIPPLKEDAQGGHLLDVLEGKRLWHGVAPFAVNGDSEVHEEVVIPLLNRSAEVVGGLGFLRKSRSLPARRGPSSGHDLGAEGGLARAAAAWSLADAATDWLSFN